MSEDKPRLLSLTESREKKLHEFLSMQMPEDRKAIEQRLTILVDYRKMIISDCMIALGANEMLEVARLEVLQVHVEAKMQEYYAAIREDGDK